MLRAEGLFREAGGGRMRKLGLGVFVIVSAVILARADVVTYTFTLLQPRLSKVSALSNCTATDINDSSNIVGSCSDESGLTHAWAFVNGNYREIDPARIGPRLNRNVSFTETIRGITR